VNQSKLTQRVEVESGKRYFRPQLQPPSATSKLSDGEGLFPEGMVNNFQAGAWQIPRSNSR
jgi:hypothetical protein